MTHEAIVFDHQWDAWQAALSGTPIPTERGKPFSGYFKRKSDKPSPKDVEIICIYRDERGELQCLRTVFGDGSKMDADAIDDLFGQVCMYPVPYEAWEIAQANEPWPPEYSTRLTMDEQKAGVVWTVELGRRKAAPGVLLADNARAVSGDNSQQLEPHEALLARVNDLEDKRREWLRSIGGAVTTQAHADKAADFKVAMAALEKEATDEHRERKKPHWDAGKAVDNAWIPIRDLAEKCRKAAATLAKPFLKAQAAASRKAAADAQRILDEAAERERQAATPTQAAMNHAPADHQPSPATPAPALVSAPIKAGTGRGVSLVEQQRCVVIDLPKLAAQLAAMDPPNIEFTEACRKLANTLLRRGDAVEGAKLETYEAAR